MTGNGWVTVHRLAELSKLAGKPVTERAIQLSIQRGKYPTAHKVTGKGKGRGGNVWLINIEDPKIPPEIRTQYYKDLATNQDKQNNDNLPIADGNEALAASPGPSAGMSFPETHIDPLSNSQGQGSSDPVPGYLSKETGQDPSIDGVSATDGNNEQPAFVSSSASHPLLSGTQGRVGDLLPAPGPCKEKAMRIALNRRAALGLWQDFRNKHSRKTGDEGADEKFKHLFNEKLIHKEIGDILGSVSVKTLYRWKACSNDGSDLESLIPRNIQKEKVVTKLSELEQKIFLRYFLDGSQFNVAEAVRCTKKDLIAMGQTTISSVQTFRNFAALIRENRADLYYAGREGKKKLKDKLLPYLEFDYSTLTVGERVVLDGHRCNFTVKPLRGAGSPFRPLMEVIIDSKSNYILGLDIKMEEGTEVVASTLRNAIITLGKYPESIHLDNGRANRAKYFTGTAVPEDEERALPGLFRMLRIKPIYAIPYNSKAKSVERFFRTFAEFEKSVPSYTGTSIENKPPWLRRNEPFHKSNHKDLIPTIKEVISSLKVWLEDYHSRPCPHVEGKSIRHVFEEGRGPGVDVNQLDVLMMVDKTSRVVDRYVKFMGNKYWGEALYGFEGEVIIKYSLFDLSYIKTYTLKGEFICNATPVGKVKDKEDQKRKMAMVRRLEKKTMLDLKEIMRHDRTIDANWQEIIDARPQIVDKLEKENILLLPHIVRIPDEALKPNNENRGMVIEIDRSITKRSIPIFEFFKRLIAEAGPISKELNQSLRTQYGESIEVSQAEEVIRNLGSSRPLFKSEIERYQWHLINGFQNEEDMEFKNRFIQTDAYRLGFKFFDDQNMRIKKEEESASAAQL